MVMGPFAAEAVARACDADLGVGLHLVLVQGAPARADARATGVTARGGFASASAAIRYFFDPTLRRAVLREVRAQLELYRATGLPSATSTTIERPPAPDAAGDARRAGTGVRHPRSALDARAGGTEPALRSAPPAAKTFEGVVLRFLSSITEKRLGRSAWCSPTVRWPAPGGACDEPYLAHPSRPCRRRQTLLPSGRGADGGDAPADARLPAGERAAALTSPRVRALSSEAGSARALVRSARRLSAALRQIPAPRGLALARCYRSRLTVIDWRRAARRAQIAASSATSARA